jgi:hypothetical protein
VTSGRSPSPAFAKIIAAVEVAALRRSTPLSENHGAIDAGSAFVAVF